jgi:hypothetical protein
MKFRNRLIFYGEELLAQPPSWRTTLCRLSATAYIFAATPHIWWPSPPSATWGCAMPWWQGTHAHMALNYNENKSRPRYFRPQVLDDMFMLSLHPTIWGWDMSTDLVCSAFASRSLSNSFQHSFCMVKWHHMHRSQTGISHWISWTFPMTSCKTKLKSNADKASLDHYEYVMHQENVHYTDICVSIPTDRFRIKDFCHPN